MKRTLAALGLAAALFTGAAFAQGEDPDPADDAAALESGDENAAVDAGAFGDGARKGLPDTTTGRRRRASGEPELTDDQAAAIGLASMCCCFVFLLGLIVLVVVLVKRAKPAATSAPAATGVPFAPPGGTHLSVLAVAFDARLRGKVEAALRATGLTTAPTTPEQRSLLVRALCTALVDFAPNWRAFGYGQKTDFADDAAAELSFRSAWSDFRSRCLEAGRPDGEVCVAVLVLCTRGAVLGTSRLEDRVQAKALVQHRIGLAPEALLAADCFLSPQDAASGALTQGDAFRRFPEMQPLGPG